MFLLTALASVGLPRICVLPQISPLAPRALLWSTPGLQPSVVVKNVHHGAMHFLLPVPLGWTLPSGLHPTNQREHEMASMLASSWRWCQLSEEYFGGGIAFVALFLCWIKGANMIKCVVQSSPGGKEHLPVLVTWSWAFFINSSMLCSTSGPSLHCAASGMCWLVTPTV